MKKRTNDPAKAVPDPTIPDVAIEIAGETYRLCFDFQALAIAKAELRKHGVQMNILQALDFSAIDVDTLPQLFFAASLHYQPNLAWEKAVGLVNLYTSVGIFSCLAAAYKAAMMEPDKNPPGATADR